MGRESVCARHTEARGTPFNEVEAGARLYGGDGEGAIARDDVAAVE